MRELLVLAYYFPPSGGPGVQRTLRFVGHLPALGWQPTVVTVRAEDAAWPSLDPDLLASIEPGIEVVRTGAFDPYAGYARLTGRRKEEVVSVGFAHAAAPGARERLARWIRANVFLPDARVGWAPFARREAVRLARSGRFDAVWSTGPPHSTHLAARAAAKAAGLPWIVDMRDAWPDPTYEHQLKTGHAARRFDAWLRSLVLDRATAIVAVGERMAESIRTLTPTPVHVIPNGYEKSDFEAVAQIPHEGFELVYAGNMPAERNPTALWSALARVRGRMPLCRVRLVGTIDASVRRSVEEAGLTDVVSFGGAVGHEEAVRRMVSSDALLLVINRTAGAEGILTGKVYEYIASGRPVVGLGPVGSDADRVVAQARAGSFHDWDDVDGVVTRLVALYEAWQSTKPLSGAEPAVARTFSREARSKELAALLDRLATGDRSGAIHPRHEPGGG